MPEFTQDQFDLADNYRVLHETTGESYESMARRLETQTQDYTTAAKIRALAKREGEPKETGNTEPTGNAQDGEGVGDSRAAGGATTDTPIKDMNVDDLRAELEAGGQPTSGKKAELQVRLAEFRANGPAGAAPSSVSDMGGVVTPTTGGSADGGSGISASSGSAPASTPTTPSPEKGADVDGAGGNADPNAKSPAAATTGS